MSKKPTLASTEQLVFALSEMMKSIHLATGGGSPAPMLNTALSVVLTHIIDDACSPEVLKQLCAQRIDWIVDSKAKLEDDKPRIIVPGGE